MRMKSNQVLFYLYGAKSQGIMAHDPSESRESPYYEFNIITVVVQTPRLVVGYL